MNARQELAAILKLSSNKPINPNLFNSSHFNLPTGFGANDPPFTAQVVQIQFEHKPETGEDGAVWYLIIGALNAGVECDKHPHRTHHYERQGFIRGGSRHRLNATPEEIAEDKANLWGWDGNTEAPTLQPSFLAQEKDKQGNVIRPYRMHSYLTNGKLTLCADSTVILATDPQNCW